MPAVDDLDLLSAYLDDALDAPTRAALEARLAADPALARTLDGLRATQALVRALPVRRAPRGFTLTAEAARQARRARVVPLVWGALSAAAATVLIALGGLLLLADAPPALPDGARGAQVAAAPTDAPTALMALATTTQAELLPEVGAAAAFERRDDDAGGVGAAPESAAALDASALADEAASADAAAPAMPFAAPPGAEADAALLQQAPAARQAPVVTLVPTLLPTAPASATATPATTPDVVRVPVAEASRPWGWAAALLLGGLALAVVAVALWRQARR